MTKTWRKSLLTAFTLLLAAGTLAACGNSKKSTSNSKSTYQDELIAGKSSKTLTIGLEGVFAPYSYRENGKLTGFEVDLGTAVAKQLNLKAKFVPTKWDSLIAGLGSRKFDVVMNNVSETPQRAKVYLFSKPYIYSHFALITSSKDKSTNSLQKIKGKKIAVGTGTNNETVAKKYGATIIPNDNYATSLQLILQGRADGTLNSSDAWYSYKKKNSTKGLTFHEVPTATEATSKVAALFSKSSPKLRSQVNKAIDTLRQDGTLKKLSEKYFGANITEDN